MLDLRYLNDFEGREVRITSLLNPQHYNNRKINTQYGILTDDNGELSIYVLTSQSSGNLIVQIDGYENFPYLGQTETLWKVEALDNGSSLFSHITSSHKEYTILGPDSEELGILSGLPRPYSSPYWKWHDEQVDGKNGEEYRIAMTELKENFKDWRKAMIV